MTNEKAPIGTPSKDYFSFSITFLTYSQYSEECTRPFLCVRVWERLRDTRGTESVLSEL